MIYPDDPLAAGICRGAQLRVPIIEDPLGSNRCPELDQLCDRWQIPRASYWCAALAADIWKDAGADVPPIAGDSHPARCESWRRWALETDRFSPTPAVGYAVLYGQGGKEPAEHMGIAIAAVKPILLDWEGNTSLAGFGRNGIIAIVKPVDTSRVIGYVSPRPLL